MKIVFFGTANFAARILSYLVEHKFTVCAVVTRPDQPVGRSLQMGITPVKKMAQELQNIPIYQPLKASSPDFVEVLRSLQADLFVVAAYGEILKSNVLEIPLKGCINVHGSLLPEYRGAAPIQRALMEGKHETGVTIIDMVLQMDAGDMLGKASVPVDDSINYGQLEQTLSEISGPLLARVIQDITLNRVSKEVQKSELVTFAPKILPEDSLLDWTHPSTSLHNRVRGLNPAPGTWCWVWIGGEKKRLKVKKTRVCANCSPGTLNKAGEMISFNAKEWIVACGSGVLELMEVQLEGKKALSAGDFFRGLNKPLSFLSP